MRKKNNELVVLDYHIYKGRLESESFFEGEKRIIVNTINAYSYVMAKRDSRFRSALLHSDILLPDGFTIQVASKVLCGTRVDKLAGQDIFNHLLNIGNVKRKKFFFLGASDRTLKALKEKLNIEYPRIEVDVYSPPYKDKFSQEDNRKMLQAINKFKPDALFVGMTAPKQEKWVENQKERIHAKVICSIGAVFDFYAGKVKRPSAFWINLRLEWFIRLVREPKRLWKRYLIHSPKFFIDIIKAKIKG